MIPEVRCTNPACRHPSRLGGDRLGRTFRCVRCGTKLPRGDLALRDPSLPAPELPWDSEVDDEAPAGRGPVRSLGVALPVRVGRLRGTSQGGNEVVAGVLRQARPVEALTHTPIATAPDPGPTLVDRLIEAGRLDPLVAAETAASLADALGRAHASGLTHGDITPARVRFAGDGQPVLTGFAPGDGTPPLDAPVFTAPERLAADPGPFEPSSDQYALGAVLYTMLCGRPPFEGPARRVIDEIRHDDPIPPRDWRPKLSRRLEAVCLKAMARDPLDRYPSCLVLADELNLWAVKARRRRGVAESVHRAGDWARRRPAAAASAALAFFGLVATTVLASALLASTHPPFSTGRPQPTEAPTVAQGRDREPL